MPTQRPRRNTLYGFPNPLKGLQQEPLIEVRAPTVQDDAELGTVWVNKVASTFYIIVARAPNANIWIGVGGGAAGVFSSLTVTPGPINLTGAFTLTAGTNTAHIADDASDHTTQLGSVTGVSNTSIGAGTGVLQLETGVTGSIAVGLGNMTGTIFLGQSTAGQTIDIGNAINTGAQVINIASGAAAAVTTVNVLNGINTAGTQNFNLMNQAGGQAGAINIGTGTAAHIVRVGSFTGAATTTILGGTGGVVLSAPFVLLNGNVHIYTGAGAPAGGLALQTGDLYINTTAASAVTRLYIATGVGAWTFFTANA